MNNPYNITLQADNNYTNSHVGSNASTAYNENASISGASVPRNPLEGSSANDSSNIFQSINYFGAATDANIPPGSEMLFGGP